MPLSDCEPFAWYFVITCENCGHKLPLFRDLSEGTSTINATYKVTCENCKQVGYYENEQIERYQHLVDRPQEPPS